jgi:hypothetical protein
MALFRTKTCEDFLQEIRRRLEVITQFPEIPPSQSATAELQVAARALARRARTMLAKIGSLNKNAAQAIAGKLYQIEDEEAQYRALKPLAVQALSFLEDLESACTAKLSKREEVLAKIKMVRGPILVYGRMMKTPEYERLILEKQLRFIKPNQLIPAFKAPDHVRKWFLKIEKKAIHNINSRIGGTGKVDYVVFFKTNIVPAVDVGPSRGWPDILEVKFPSGTPVEIIQVRRV